MDRKAYYDAYREANRQKIREKDRRWREKNREALNAKRREYHQRRFLEQRALVLMLKGNICSDCGREFMSRELHFHHLDPTEKSFGVSNPGIRASPRRIREEIAKCVVLCQDCHTRVHHG